jgi:hypothetical protein
MLGLPDRGFRSPGGPPHTLRGMAAPEYVPRPKAERARVYESPPWRHESWLAERPADLDDGQPVGPGLGHPGPDQGFMLRLVRQFDGRLVLGPDEDEDDVIAGACAIALRRASLFGRGPVIHDLTVALRAFGFLGEGERGTDPELVEFRRPLFEGCADLHHYAHLQALVDLVPEPVLRLSPQQVRDRAAADWRGLFKTRV